MRRHSGSTYFRYGKCHASLHRLGILRAWGLISYTRNHSYSHSNLPASIQNQNDSVMVGAMVGGLDGINNLEVFVV